MRLLEFIEQLFAQYGYLVLLFGLPLDAIALPIPPGNTTLTFAGYLSYKGVLHLIPAFAAAWMGSMLGITITYLIGSRLGAPFIKRYGKWLFLKQERLEKAKKYYGKYGNKLLLFSYFIPGIRQFIGYFTGTIRVPYRSFALYAYTGSALWVAAFFGIGYIFGEQWQYAFQWVERFLKYAFIGFGIVLVIYFLVKWRKKQSPKRY